MVGVKHFSQFMVLECFFLSGFLGFSLFHVFKLILGFRMFGFLKFLGCRVFYAVGISGFRVARPSGRYGCLGLWLLDFRAVGFLRILGGFRVSRVSMLFYGFSR